MKSLFILGLISTLFLSCNKSGGGGGSAAPAPAPAYWYHFDEGSNPIICTTDRHEFTNQTEYCNALQDSVRNKNCAYQQRLERYQAQCANQSNGYTNGFNNNNSNYGYSDNGYGTGYFTVTPSSASPNYTVAFVDQAVNGEYSYVGQNGCSTGTRKFQTLRDGCAVLLDNALNNNCVEATRRLIHSQYCTPYGL